MNRQPDLCHRLKYALQLTDESLQAKESAADADRAKWALHMAQSSKTVVSSEDSSSLDPSPKTSTTMRGLKGDDHQMEMDVGVLFGMNPKTTEWKQQRDRWKIEEKMRARNISRPRSAGVDVEEPFLTMSMDGGGDPHKKKGSSDLSDASHAGSFSGLSSSSSLLGELGKPGSTLLGDLGKTAADSILLFGGKTAESLLHLPVPLHVPVTSGKLINRHTSMEGMELQTSSSDDIPEVAVHITGDYAQAISSLADIAPDQIHTRPPATGETQSSIFMVPVHRHTDAHATTAEASKKVSERDGTGKVPVAESHDAEEVARFPCPEKPECGPPSASDLLAATQRICEAFGKPQGKESFLRVLNKQRSEKTCLASPPSADNNTLSSPPCGFTCLKDCIFQLLTLAEESMDVKTTKMIMILSETFYYEDDTADGKSRKVYIQEFARKHPVWNKLTYWTEAFKLNVLEEVEKLAMGSSQRWPDLDEKGREDLVVQVHNIVFGTLGSFVLNMNDFGVPKAQTRQFLKDMSKLNELSEEQCLLVLAGVPIEDSENVETTLSVSPESVTTIPTKLPAAGIPLKPRSLPDPSTDAAGSRLGETRPLPKIPAAGLPLDPRSLPVLSTDAVAVISNGTKNASNGVQAVETPVPILIVDPKVDEAISALLSDSSKEANGTGGKSSDEMSQSAIFASDEILKAQIDSDIPDKRRDSGSSYHDLSSSDNYGRPRTPDQPLFGARTDDDEFLKLIESHTDVDDFLKLKAAAPLPISSPLLDQSEEGGETEGSGSGWRNRRNKYATGFY